MSLTLTPFIRSAILFSTIGLLAASSATAQTPASVNTPLPTPATDVIIPTDSESAPSATTPTGDSIPTTGNMPLNSVRFACRMDNGRYTVMYQPESQPGQFYAWAVPQTMGGNWSAESRCQEISRRLESYRPDGLVEMQTSVENGYNTVCVTTDNIPSCRIVFTVPSGQDPIATRNRVFENLAIADSGQSTAGVFMLRDGQSGQVLEQLGQALNINLGGLLGGSRSSPTQTISTRNGIYLKPFLDQADGGTGEWLNRRKMRAASQLPTTGLRCLQDVFR